MLIILVNELFTVETITDQRHNGTIVKAAVTD